MPRLPSATPSSRSSERRAVESLHEFQIGRIVLDIEHGARRSAIRRERSPQCGALRLPGYELRCRRQGQFDPEYASHPDRTIRANGSAHQFDQPLGHHQPDTGAFLRAGFLAQPIERLEQAAQPVPERVPRQCRGCRYELNPDGSRRIRQTAPPGLLYLIALKSRLISTCLTRVRSALTKQGISNGGNVMVTPRFWRLRLNHGPGIRA